MPMCSYLVVSKSAIVSTIFASSFGLSLNPGVSMSTTVLLSRVNSSESWTSVVHGPKPVASGRFEPLARLTNWRNSSQFPVIVTKHTLLACVFPLPVAPTTL